MLGRRFLYRQGNVTGVTSYVVKEVAQHRAGGHGSPGTAAPDKNLPHRVAPVKQSRFTGANASQWVFAGQKNIAHLGLLAI